jgi:hypothetical protein
MMYAAGQRTALSRLGLTKEAANPLRAWFRQVLEHPKGSTALKVPIQMILGGAGGAIAGQLHSEDPWGGAALGAGSLGVRGLAVDYVPELRKALLKKL